MATKRKSENVHTDFVHYIADNDADKKLEETLFRIESWVFNDGAQAHTLLEKAQKYLNNQTSSHLQLNYYSLAGVVENQLYNLKASDKYFKKALKFARTASAEILVDFYIDYAGTLINEKEIATATQVISKTQQLLEKSNNEKLSARLQCREAYLYLICSDFNHAYEVFFQVEKKMQALISIAPTSKDYYFLTLIYAGLGSVYEKIGDDTRSVMAYLKVIDICTAHNINTRLAWHYLNVGKAFMALQNFTEAENYFQKVIQNSDDLSVSARVFATTNLGFCYYKKNDFAAARTYFEKSELFFDNTEKNSLDNLSQLDYWRGLVYKAEGNSEYTERYWSNALDYAKSAQNFAQQAMLCREISEFYAEKKDFGEAYQYQCLHVDFVKMQNEESKQNTLRDLELKYDLERQKQEIEMLRIQTNQLQLKALRAQMNPHFIFNALNAVQSYVFKGDKMLAVKYLAIFADLMRKSLEYSETEFISLKNEITFLESYLLVNQKLRFDESFQYKITVDEDIEEEIIGVPTMIVQPYIENAIEHGIRPQRGGNIKIHFATDAHSDDFILCTVDDDGVGIDISRALQTQNAAMKKHNSRGTGITEKRLEILNRENKEKLLVNYVDKSREGKTGTRVEIKIPVKQL